VLFQELGSDLMIDFSGVPEVRHRVQDPDRQLLVSDAARHVQLAHPPAGKFAGSMSGNKSPQQ
jgi:hypothetical protein